jgi:hypothetical protein
MRTLQALPPSISNALQNLMLSGANVRLEQNGLGGGTVGVPSGLAVDCAGSHPRCVVARLYPGVGRALVQTWVPVLGTVEGAIVSLGP